MKKVISMVMLAILVATIGVAVGFSNGREYERKNFKYEFFFSESEKEVLRASFLASGAEQIGEDIFELRWSENGEEVSTRCDLRVGLSEQQVHKLLVFMNELGCYMDSTKLGRMTTTSFYNSESFYMP